MNVKIWYNIYMDGALERSVSNYDDAIDTLEALEEWYPDNVFEMREEIQG